MDLYDKETEKGTIPDYYFDNFNGDIGIPSDKRDISFCAVCDSLSDYWI